MKKDPRDTALQTERFPHDLRRALHIWRSERGIHLRDLMLEILRNAVDAHRKEPKQ